MVHLITGRLAYYFQPKKPSRGLDKHDCLGTQPDQQRFHDFHITEAVVVIRPSLVDTFTATLADADVTLSTFSKSPGDDNLLDDLLALLS